MDRFQEIGKWCTRSQVRAVDPGKVRGGAYTVKAYLLEMLVCGLRVIKVHPKNGVFVQYDRVEYFTQTPDQVRTVVHGHGRIREHFLPFSKPEKVHYLMARYLPHTFGTKVTYVEGPRVEPPRVHGNKRNVRSHGPYVWWKIYLEMFSQGREELALDRAPTAFVRLKCRTKLFRMRPSKGASVLEAGAPNLVERRHALQTFSKVRVTTEDERTLIPTTLLVPKKRTEHICLLA